MVASRISRRRILKMSTIRWPGVRSWAASAIPKPAAVAQDDNGPRDVFLRAVAIRHDRLQPSAIVAVTSKEMRQIGLNPDRLIFIDKTDASAILAGSISAESWSSYCWSRIKARAHLRALAEIPQSHDKSMHPAKDICCNVEVIC